MTTQRSMPLRQIESMTEKKEITKPNLLIVTTSLYFGGAQKVAYILAASLCETYNVTVAYCFDSGRRHEFPEQCRIRKLPEYARNAGLMEKSLYIGKQIRALKDLKLELNIEVSLSLGNIANLINAFSKGKERVICCERSNPERSWGRMYRLTHLILRRADFVIFQSETIRQLYGEEIRRKSRILKNPLVRPQPADRQREKKIVTLGRLAPQKNHALLIRSFARFHQMYPAYRLYIFGNGELAEPLNDLTASLGLQDCVFLEKNDPAVHERIRDAEMFVLSSDFEGLSNALLECMAMGIACISTRCEGSRDVIRNGENGLLTGIGDEEGLVRAMCTLAADPQLRQKLERQAMADMQAYDRELVIKDWDDTIRQCMNMEKKETENE